MTPQERRLLEELFDRLASLENTPRDPVAVGAINEGLTRAPNALYPLVQSVLVQDEALKRADQRIRELEAELGIEPGQGTAQPGSFLDGMREDMRDRHEPQGSVPSVRPGTGTPISGAWRTTSLPQSGAAPSSAPPSSVWRDARSPQQAGYPPAQEPPSSGGSFLGTAAAGVAGVVGGALLMNSFRGMFGGHQNQGQSAINPGGGSGMPWGSSGGGDLARQAGIDDITGGGKTAALGDNGNSQPAGLFDAGSSDNSEPDFANDLSDDFEVDGDSDTL